VDDLIQSYGLFKLRSKKMPVVRDGSVATASKDRSRPRGMWLTTLTIPPA
jgi:hypothetical protein